MIFRLSTCCGLRVSEISQLLLGDVVVDGPRPVVKIRAATTKGEAGKKRGRMVPLWWDTGTLEDLRAWKLEREGQGAGDRDPFVCRLRHPTLGTRLNRSGLSKRWKHALLALGKGRVKQLSIHCGRHSFASHAIYVGRSLVEVMQALGHRSLSVTTIYAHLLERDGVGELFKFEE